MRALLPPSLPLMIALIVSLGFPLATQAAASGCDGFSWLSEHHAKRRGINCRSASREIQLVFDSIKSAANSGRRVEVDNFGEFYLGVSKSKAKRSTQKRLRFKSSTDLKISSNILEQSD